MHETADRRKTANRRKRIRSTDGRQSTGVGRSTGMWKIPVMFDAIVISVHKYDSHQDAALDLLGRAVQRTPS